MNLTGSNSFIEKEMQEIAVDLNAKLQFETRVFNSNATSDIFLSCSFLPINPHLITFRETRNQAIMQIDYFCDVKAKTETDEANIQTIVDHFNINHNISDGVIIYQPTARSQWLNKDAKRVVAISVYLEFDEVI